MIEYHAQVDYAMTNLLNDRESVNILYFTAPWCVPCKMLKPRLEQIEETNEGVVRVIRVDVESNPELATKHNIRSVPTLLFYAGGRQVAELTGAKQNKEIQEIIDRFKD